MDEGILRSRPYRKRSRLNHGQLGSDSTCLISSIKVEVKKKHLSCGWSFSCFAAHLIKRDLF